MTPSTSFEVVQGTLPPRPFYLVIDRPLADLPPRAQSLVREISARGIMVTGWDADGTENNAGTALPAFCALNGIDPAQAVYIGRIPPSKKVAFGTVRIASTESDLIDALMSVLT